MTTRSEETRDFLVAGTIKDIAALIEACDFPPQTYVLAEQLPQHVIAKEQRQELLQFIDVNELKARNASGDPARRIDVAGYGTGRIFCSAFELRWSRDQRTGKVRAIYLGSRKPEEVGIVFDEISQTSDENSERKPPEDLAKLRRQERTYYLFGTTLDTSLDGKRMEQMHLTQENGWRYYAEVRIPRLLRYPRVDDPRKERRVRLVVCEYVDKETDSVKLFRFQKLEAAE
jgi:hypothetical protein